MYKRQGIEFKNEFVIVGQLDSETDILGIAQLFYGIIQIVSCLLYTSLQFETACSNDKPDDRKNILSHTFINRSLVFYNGIASFILQKEKAYAEA